MVKTKTVGWAIVGIFAVWYLLASGKIKEYNEKIYWELLKPILGSKWSPDKPQYASTVEMQMPPYHLYV